MRYANIPYTVVGGLRFYERKEVKDVLAYLCLIVNPDDSVSLKRVINYPHRGIGKQTINKLELFSHEKGMSLFKALKHAKEVPGISLKRAEAVISFYDLVHKYRKLRNKMSMKELVSAVIEEAKFQQNLEMEQARDT